MGNFFDLISSNSIYNITNSGITVPDAPTGVNGTSGVVSGSVVSWTPPSSNGNAVITNYSVQYALSPYSSWVTATSSGTSGMTISGLTGLTSYEFRIAAINISGISSYSAASSPITTSASGSQYPSGFTPPAVPSGYTLGAFDDFTSTSLNPMWSGAYNGQSGAAFPGIFLASHFVLTGDSWLRLEAYPDPANWSNSFGSTLAIAQSVNFWCGAGIQTGTRWPVGTIFTWATKWDTYPGMTPIVLTMGNNWPPEQDLIEVGGITTKGQAVPNYTASFLYASPRQQHQLTVSNGAITDFSKTHMYQAIWTASGTTLTCDGHLVCTTTFDTSMTTGAGIFGLQNDQFIALQHQTGDWTNPAADGTITSANPIVQYFDWVQICVPA
jgi:hypothetical protein